MTLLNWKDSPNGRNSKAQGVDGEYRIGRYDTEERPWPEHGIVVPAETWFEVQLRGPNEKRGGYSAWRIPGGQIGRCAAWPSGLCAHYLAG
jgi:hypothetical protein